MDHDTRDLKVAFQPNPQGPMKYLAFLVLIALFAFLAASTKNAFRGGDAIDQNIITVSGEARQLAKPDIAIASFTIMKENAALEVARDDVSRLSNKVTDFLKAQGVEEKDIKTTSYTMYPREFDDTSPCILAPGADYRCPPRKTIKTYVVEETFEVRMRKIERAGNIIAGVSKEGVNQVGSLRFTVDEPRMKELQQKARGEAIAKAREDAKKLARDLGVRLGKLKNFSESGGPYPQPYFERFAKGADTASVPSPSIAPGENEIVSNVTLIYEIR